MVAVISTGGKYAVAVSALVFLTGILVASLLHHRKPHIAFIGNSLTYYNDLPRVLESMAPEIVQRSCLHGGQSLETIFYKGNGMKVYWKTSKAKVTTKEGNVVHDYGACTIRHLLTGQDGNLTQNNANGYYVIHEQRNPCLHGGLYLNYALQQIPVNPYYKYIVMNDHSRKPMYSKSRQRTLDALKTNYTPILRQMEESTPVFIATHAYEKDGLNLSIPEFTSRIYHAYQEYVQFLEQQVPFYSTSTEKKPRIVPSGLGFLYVWERNYTLWQNLFYTDGLHPSPHGTYLTACILHATLFGRMPPKVENVSFFFRKSRRLFFGNADSEFPDPTEADYLRKVCKQVGLKGILPDSFILYDMNDDEVASDDWA